MLKVVQKPHLTNYIELWWDSGDWAHAPAESLLTEVSNWVAANELGRRTAHNGWQFRSSAAVTAFMLRWSPP